MFTKRAHGFSKRIYQVFPGLMALVLICLTGCATTMHNPSGGVQSYVDDVEYLSAYGGWVDYPPYGVVWLPDVVPGWEPFYKFLPENPMLLSMGMNGIEGLHCSPERRMYNPPIWVQGVHIGRALIRNTS